MGEGTIGEGGGCVTPPLQCQRTDTMSHSGAGKASWERGKCPKVLLGGVIDFITGVRTPHCGAIDSWRRTTGVEDNGDDVAHRSLC